MNDERYKMMESTNLCLSFIETFLYQSGQGFLLAGMDKDEKKEMFNALKASIISFITVINHEKIIDKTTSKNEFLINNETVNKAFGMKAVRNRLTFASQLRNALAHGNFVFDENFKTAIYHIKNGNTNYREAQINLDFLLKFNDETLEKPEFKINFDNNYSMMKRNANKKKINDQTDLVDYLNKIIIAELNLINDKHYRLRNFTSVKSDKELEIIFNEIDQITMFYEMSPIEQEAIIHGVVESHFKEFDLNKSLRVLFDIVNSICNETVDMELICRNYYSIVHTLNLLIFYNKYIYNYDTLRTNNFNFENLEITGYTVKYPRNLNFKRKQSIITHLRNSLSHSNRFKLLRDKNGNILYEFKDYDKNGLLSFDITIDFLKFFDMVHNTKNDALLNQEYIEKMDEKKR